MHSNDESLRESEYIDCASNLHKHLTTVRFIKRGDEGDESHFFYATAAPTMI